MKNIQKAVCEIQLADIAHKEEINSSMKTYQTIKCESTYILYSEVCSEEIYLWRYNFAGMIALKRKLKRIRENKDPQPTWTVQNQIQYLAELSLQKTENRSRSLNVQFDAKPLSNNQMKNLWNESFPTISFRLYGICWFHFENFMKTHHSKYHEHINPTHSLKSPSQQNHTDTKPHWIHLCRGRTILRCNDKFQNDKKEAS